MKLNLEQRTKLFNIVRETILKNVEKVNIISSDHPNLSFLYDDDRLEILYVYNINGTRSLTSELLQISLYNKEIDISIKFDSSDYILMKNLSDMTDLTSEINEKIFKTDDSDTQVEELINKVLDLK